MPIKLADMASRYAEYKKTYNGVWASHFTWDGMFGDTPKHSISIVEWEKDTSCLGNMRKCKHAKEFYKTMKDMSECYAGWCAQKDKFLDSEDLHAIKNFFMGAMGEFFFTALLDSVKCILVKSETSGKLERFYFSNTAPRLLSDEDWGVDMTSTISHGRSTYPSAIQAKFWDFENDIKITSNLAKGVYGDAVLRGFIKPDQKKNVVICWLGDTDKVSIYLKKNKELYKHILFVDMPTLDININMNLDAFWTELQNRIRQIKNFQ